MRRGGRRVRRGEDEVQKLGRVHAEGLDSCQQQQQELAGQDAACNVAGLKGGGRTSRGEASAGLELGGDLRGEGGVVHG